MKNSYIAPAIFVLCIVALLGAFFAINNFIYNQKQREAPVTQPYQATLTGTQVCLPPKDLSVPQTMECAIGILTDLGEHYALSLDRVSPEYMSLPSGTVFSASGLVTPVENLSNTQFQKYDIRGILVVDEFVIIDQPTPPPTPPPAPTPAPAPPQEPVSSAACYVGGCSSQVCSDQPDVITTCEYREEYACYQRATCERQPTGQCGWTPTAELSACLANN